MCVERVEQETQDTALWGSYVQGDGVGGKLAHFHHLRYLCHFPLHCTITLFHRLSGGSFNGCDLHGHLLLLNLQTGIRNYQCSCESVLVGKG